MSEAAASPEDRFSLRPILLPIAVALPMGVVYSFWPAFAFFLLRPLWLILVLGWLIWAIWRIVGAARRRGWRSVLSLAFVLVLALPAGSYLNGPVIGDYVHLLLLYPYYRAKIDASRDHANKPLEFYWGADGLSIAGDMRWLVYDPTGKILGEAQHNNGNGIDTEIKHLIGNFYVRHQSW